MTSQASGEKVDLVEVEARFLRDQDEFRSPHWADVEVTQGLRRLVLAGEVSADRAAKAIADLADVDLHRHARLDRAAVDPARLTC